MPPKNASPSDTRYAKVGEYVSRNIAGETLVVPVRGRRGDLDSIYNLNEVACFIWNRIDGSTSLAEIAAGVCSEFEVAPESAEADVREFVAVLEEAGLIAPTGQEG